MSEPIEFSFDFNPIEASFEEIETFFANAGFTTTQAIALTALAVSFTGLLAKRDKQ